MTGPLPVHWESAMRELRRAWGLFGPAPTTVSDWETAIEAMASVMSRAKAAGGWRAGRADLLHTAGRGGDELVHSNVLSWLLSPSARHGWGPAFLVDLVKETWGVPLNGADMASVRREVHRSTNTRKRIADVIVTAGGTRLVIENKVYSDESKNQCEDLYRLWIRPSPGQPTEAREVRFVLLSRHGRMPWSAGEEARGRWRGLSYRWVVRWLEENMGRVTSPVARLAAEAVSCHGSPAQRLHTNSSRAVGPRPAGRVSSPNPEVP